MATTKAGRMAKAPARTAKRRTAPAGRRAPKRPAAGKRRAAGRPPTLAPVKGAERHDAGDVRLEIGRVGDARVKRAVYPPGFRWSADLKPTVGTEWCMHAHVGVLVSGAIRIAYPDGCVVDYEAPEIVAIDPGHDGSVVGPAPAVLIEFDFEGDTVERLGVPASHRHA